MIWQYSSWFVPCIACGLILLILGITGWRNRSCVCARSFSLLMIAGSVWAFCTALELSSADMQTQMLAILIEYPAMSLIPVAWLLFAFEYTGRSYWITRENILLLCIIPVVTVLMVATNGFHHLFYPTVTASVVESLRYHVVTYGPAFWLHALYSYTLILATLLLIFQRYIYSFPVYRRQVVIILIATVIPLGANLALVFRLGSLELIDPTPFAMMISGFIILYGILRFQLLDLSPVANEQILENLKDGVIVVDLQGRIVSLNSTAGTFLGIDRETAIGSAIGGFLPALEGISESVPSGEVITEMERPAGGKKEYFELRCLPLRSRGPDVQGQVILIRTITDQKQNEIALAAAREKLTLLSSVTRHDILNQVTALLLHIDVAKSTIRDPVSQEWLAQQEEAVLRIQGQVEFARDFEDLGALPPQWTEIFSLFSELKPRVARPGIMLEIPPGQIEIFADPLLARACYNLVEYSIKNGGPVTTIRLRYVIADHGLILVYEDNGTGIPTAEKTNLFRRDSGNPAGLGLFLVAEILGITGMTIRECGEPQKGVRFEIHVPYGRFRIIS